MAITDKEKHVTYYSANPHGIMNAKFFNTMPHQWKCFIFPLIAYIMCGKLHVNGVYPD
jgi:hypothetical protein